ncbi:MULTISPECIES: hypothetical protein [Pectobacterium]|uniref:hypothetical protein n=1 Tax=Pectobacterium TaxID=122277 RepID=UPI000C1BD428|nr:hypothetical protein [Pectobacterium brasiliense]ATV42510.1 hypothetical protein CTV95_03150 [Pectobacterium brasiliense]MBA0210030.1 hypothetical protein [Pectobacterium brasiliense]MBN3159513.1 hypothetical protein [Pectobacterium brasiliense]MCA6983361.1 hypothetical protein [Pectobacterium brasiliense]MCH4992913.1 hypothetical protein [Pectobacterium brasiliense]
MNVSYFKEFIAPQLSKCKLTYSSYPNGDFGSLERVVIEGGGKIAGVDIWSKGWLDIDIYDLLLDEQIMNVLLEPTEFQQQEYAISKLLELLLNEK